MLRGNKSSTWIAAPDGSQPKPLIQADRNVGASAFSPDGKRLLVVLPEGPGGGERTSINVVLNWVEELNAKVPKER